MADNEALAAWKAELATRRALAIAPAPAPDPIQDAAARRAADRAAILGNGDTWTRQAVAYERAMTTPPKPDPTERTKRWQAARYGGLSRGTRP